MSTMLRGLADLATRVRLAFGAGVPTGLEPFEGDAPLIAAGERAARELELLWGLDIIDPKIGSKDPRASSSLLVINQIIGANGWGNRSQAEVIGGARNTSYRGNGTPQWCGMTAGEVWRRAGLDASWLPSYWASTDRLIAWASYKRFLPTSKANPAPPSGHPRRLLVRLQRGKPAPEIRRGDVVIVGNGKRKAGDHVTIAVGVEGRNIDTISGNGGGFGPHGGARREGISRCYYHLDETKGYVPMWLVRPSVDDVL